MNDEANGLAVRPDARNPLLGNGVRTFGIASWIFHAVVYLVATIVGLTISSTNPPAVRVLLLTVASVLTLFSILLAVIRTIWIAVDLGRSGDVPGYARILFLVLSILPSAIGLFSTIVLNLHIWIDIGSVVEYQRSASAISTVTMIFTMLLPVGVGTYLLARTIKGGKRELAIAAMLVVQRLVQMVPVGRFSVEIVNPANGILGIVIVVAASAIHVSILSDLAKSDWRTIRKSPAGV